LPQGFTTAESGTRRPAPERCADHIAEENSDRARRSGESGRHGDLGRRESSIVPGRDGRAVSHDPWMQSPYVQGGEIGSRTTDTPPGWSMITCGWRKPRSPVILTNTGKLERYRQCSVMILNQARIHVRASAPLRARRRVLLNGRI